MAEYPSSSARLLAILAPVGVALAAMAFVAGAPAPEPVVIAAAPADASPAYLNGTPASSGLSDGSALNLDVTSPTEGEDGTLTLDARFWLEAASSAPEAVVFVLDVSNSALGPGDGCGGDFDADGRVDTVVDCELSSTLQAVEEMGRWGTVQDVSVVLFSTFGVITDVQPTTGRQTFTRPLADLDADGVLDVEQVLRSVGRLGFTSRGAEEFTRVYTGGVFAALTNFGQALTRACTALGATSQPRQTIVFLSDGEASTGDPIADVLPCTEPVTIHTVAVGPGSGCDLDGRGRGSLRNIATLGGGTCTQITEPDELADVLGGAVIPRITQVTVSIDGGDAVDVSDQVAEGIPYRGEGELSVSLDLGVLDGEHTVCVTVTAEDGSGTETTVTECVATESNEAPVADAGVDQVVAEGALVTLDGSGSSDPDGDALSYRWEIVGEEGPVLVLPGAVLPSPTLQTLDDGVYTFELTVSDGELEATDSVTVMVINEVPAASGVLDGAATEGIALLTATLTDAGVLDTHAATVDWGDGTSPETVDVTAQGTGWGSLYASHRYTSAGNYTVTATLTDDDGGAVELPLSVEISRAVAIYATGTSGDAIDWTGGSGTIEGLVHTNAGIRVRGSSKTLTGDVEYVTSASLASGAVTGSTSQVAAADAPIAYTFANYEPGGRAAVEAGADYHDQTTSCSGGRWQVSGALAPGLYYADCDVQLLTPQSDVTLASTGEIEVTSQGTNLRPFVDGLLFITEESGRAIKVAASGGTYLGHLVAPNGTVDISGSTNRFLCGIVAESVDLSGSGLSVEASDCVRPDRTTAPPILVPVLTVALANDVDESLPSQSVTSTVTVTNGSTHLLVPGIVGLQNHGTAAVTVTAGDVWIEVLEAGATAWTALPVDATLSTQSNASTGVAYADGFVGTVINGGGLASWGAELQVDLPAETVAWLLDEAQVDAVRTAVAFEVDDATAPVRSLYRFGDDLADDLRTQGADVTDLAVTLTTIDGNAEALDASNSDVPTTLGAGQEVSVSADALSPAAGAIGSTESSSAYLARLLALDDATLGSLVSARGTGGIGVVLGPWDVATTTLRVPVVEPSWEVPSNGTAGDAFAVGVSLANRSTATALTVASTASIGDSADEKTFASLASGGSASDTLEVILSSSLAGTYAIATVATGWYDLLGSGYGPVSDTYDVFVEVAPILEATLAGGLQVDADDNGVANAGDTLRYTANVTNAGSTSVDGVIVALALDANVTLVDGSVELSQGTSSAASDALTANLGTLTGDGSATVTFDALVLDPLPEGVETVTLYAEVTSNTLDPVIPDPVTTALASDDPSLEAVLVDDLALDADADGAASTGDTLEYVAEIANTGLAHAESVVFELAVPARAALVAGSVETDAGTVTLGNTDGDTTIRVEVGTVEAQGFANVSFQLVARGAPGATLSAQGSVTGADVDALVTDDPDTETEDDATSTTLGGTIDPEDQPSVTLVSPADGDRVGAPVSVVASVSSGSGGTVESWQVELAEAGSDESVVLASGTGDLPDSLVDFDPTLLENGLWTLTVVVTDALGYEGVAEASVEVAGAMKLGSYDLAFVDAEWHSSVTQVSLLRSYSTLRKDIVGDFGHGWRLGMLDMRIQRNGPLGDGGWRQEACGTGFIYYPVCTVADDPHLVVVRWPDGWTEAFDLTPAEGSSYFAGVTTAAFTPRAGATSSLEPADGTSLFHYDGNLYDGLTLETLYDPQQYWLTDRDGVMYLLDIDEGLLETVDRNGNRVVYSEDGITPDRGVGVSFERDGEGRIARIDLADGSSIEYGYDGNGDLVNVTDQLGDVTEFEYDEHRLVSYNAEGRAPVAEVVYDADGRLLSRADASGVLVEHSVDLDGYTQTTVGPDPALTTTRTFDSDGLLVSVVQSFDGTLIESTWTYDDELRVETVTSPGGGVLTLGYDDAGRVTSVLDPDGVLTEWERNEAGDVEAIYVDGEMKAGATYDSAGNLLARLSADGSTLTATTYDTWGGPLTWSDADGGSGSILYDSAYQVRGFVANGRTVEFTLDGYGRAVSATDAEGDHGTAVFDARGEMSEFTDPNGHVERWTYDERGFLVSTTDKAARDNTFTYDEAGYLLTETTRTGEVVEFSYDAAGRLARVEGPDAWVAYEHDPLGRLTRVENAEQVVEIHYDDDGNVLSETVTPVTVGAYPTTATSYAWSSGGRLLSASSTEGSRTYTYDSQGRVETLTDSHAGTTTFGWDADDRLVSVERSTGVTTTLSYTALGRLQRLSTSADGVVIDSLALTRAEDGRIEAKTDADGEHGYTYDGRGQLTAATHPAASGLDDEAYTYDANGNRRAWAGNAAADVLHDADLLEGDARFSYTHDREGRLSTKVDVETLETTTYRWNSFDQLVAIEHPDGSETTFAYDGLGRRIEVVHLGTATRFGYDGGEVRTVFDEDNALESWLSTDPAGGLLAEVDVASGEVRDALLDQLGTRRGWVTGGTVETTARDSFGNATAGASGRVEPHALTWHAQDPTGLVYARARYLDTEAGRFLSEDPVRAQNAYAYVANDPITQWDPDGRVAAVEYGADSTKDAGYQPPAGHIGVRVSCQIIQAALTVDLVAVGAGVSMLVEGACDASGGSLTVWVRNGCFTAGTEVLVPDGVAAIESIRAGDQVVAWEEGQEVESTVLRAHARRVPAVIEAVVRYPSGRTDLLTATPDHPFYAPEHRGYIDLEDLEPGAALITAEGAAARLVSKRARVGATTVYNLEVDEQHNYYVRAPGSDAEGVLVHNGRCFDKLKESGYYVVQSGASYYCGKGGVGRASGSASRLGGVLETFEGTSNSVEAFMGEAVCMAILKDKTSNRIGSPGTRYLKMLLKQNGFIK